MIILRTNNVHAMSVEDLTYSGFTNEQMSVIIPFIEEYKGNYDSVFVSYGWWYPSGEQRLYFFFYDYEDIGKLYKIYNNNAGNQYTVYSHFSEANAVYYTTNLMDGQLSPTSPPGYRSDIQRAITNQYDSSTGTADYNKPCCFVTNRSIYTDDSFTNIWFQASDNSIEDTYPYIINYSSISSWNFNYMQIGGYILAGDTSNATYSYTLYANINNGDYTSSLNVKPYLFSTDNGNHYQINVPRQQLLQNYNLEPNDIIHFSLRVRLDYRGSYITDTYNLGTFTIGVTQSQADNINSNSNRQQLQNIENGIDNVNNSIQETTQAVEQTTQAVEDNTQAINDLNNTISDPTIETGASDLPSNDTNDITRDGINSIFQSIYNAFCTGQAQDIVFPIPFTNKSITLSPYYVRDMLNNNGGGWVYTLIQAFWGYLIGRFIVKDVMNKINKIKSGNIEAIETSNIKGEML